MMRLADMLNPVEGDCPQSPLSTRAASETNPEPAPPQKRLKLAKDAPIFSEGKPTGQVRFPPSVDFTDLEHRDMSSFNLFPNVSDITAYPRHIPYSSDKKTFQQKTGREAFEVFQYTFKLSAEDRTHTVMWDYNVGLAVQEQKKLTAQTIPGKMLASNPGLKEVCHSITGGALAAQGYWMPFAAAKALATTFCYPIRHALMPLFGPEFASDCLDPNDEGYGHMVIDRAIIEQCAREAATVRRETTQNDTVSCSYSDAYGGLSPSPSNSELSTGANTPCFFEPVYTPALSLPDRTSQRPYKEKGRGRKIAYVRQRWNYPKVPEHLERRNGFASPSSSTTYLPSPTSDTSASIEVKKALDRLDIPRSHVSSLLSASHPTLSSSRALIAVCSLEDRSVTKQSLDKYVEEFSDEETGAPGQIRGRLDGPRPSYAAIETSSECSPKSLHSRDLHFKDGGVDAEALARRLQNLEAKKLPPGTEDVAAALTLWLLHMVDGKYRSGPSTKEPTPCNVLKTDEQQSLKRSKPLGAAAEEMQASTSSESTAKRKRRASA